MTSLRTRILILSWLLLTSMSFEVRSAFADELTHGYATSGDVKIHYVEQGTGPLVIMLHGFPDFWYTWRKQMPAISKTHRVVAIDQRGYNKSDKPEGVENYDIKKLTGDVKAVIEHLGEKEATIVGHDWGGFVAWSFAMQYPQHTSKLIVLNLPHPWALRRELANNPEQAKNSQYARNFQKPNVHRFLNAKGLAEWVKDEEAREVYVEAFERSSFEAMLNYYKANYPKAPYAAPEGAPPKVKCPVLVIHGLGDIYLLASGLNETWKWVEKDLTIVTVPDAEHFVQQDKPEFVTKTIVSWLNR